jgi:hypothetical protein
MTTGRMIELAVALLLLAASIWLYRARKTADQGYGSQGAVLLLAVAAIMAIHALGGLDYHPSQSELEIFKEQGRQ